MSECGWGCRPKDCTHRDERPRTLCLSCGQTQRSKAPGKCELCGHPLGMEAPRRAETSKARR